MFYGKLTSTTTPKILSVSPLTTKEHPYIVNNPQGSFFIINLYSIFDCSLIMTFPNKKANSRLKKNIIIY